MLLFVYNESKDLGLVPMMCIFNEYLTTLTFMASLE